MGYIYNKLKQKKEAFIAYEKALYYDPYDIQTQLEYAQILEIEKPMKALKCYKQALKLMKIQ